jgi:hypothetical protein
MTICHSSSGEVYEKTPKEPQAPADAVAGRIARAVNPSLAVVPVPDAVSRPDISWMKKHVPVLGVARALGLTIRHCKAKCWRVENHRHGDVDPSLSFFEKRNRCRCFVCDMRGGHSNIDLVMGVLGCDLGSAVQWIAGRFTVPNIKVGRPSGNAMASPTPYRVGVHGSEWEVIVRSGMWGAMTVAERSILVTLDYLKDSETGLTRLSYRGIMRYSGVKKMANVSSALKELKKIHALQSVAGLRCGLVRECSTYRPTLTDPKFLYLCNEVFASERAPIAQEREYRASLKAKRQRDARKPNGPSLQVVPQNTNTEGGLCPPAPPAACVSKSNSKTLNQHQETPTCEGLNLSSPGEVRADLSLPRGQREISTPAFEKLQRDKQILRERGFLR